MKGWKQAYTPCRRFVVLVELDIPEDARVSHLPKYGLTKDIWITDKAKVVSVTSLDGKHSVPEAASMKSLDFKYEVGKMVVAEKDRSLGNRPGIYFFKTKEQAQKYQF